MEVWGDLARCTHLRAKNELNALVTARLPQGVLEPSKRLLGAARLGDDRDKVDVGRRQGEAGRAARAEDRTRDVSSGEGGWMQRYRVRSPLTHLDPKISRREVG